MRLHVFTLALACVFQLCRLPASAQTVQNQASMHPTKASTDTDNPIAILEVGASTNWNFSGGAATFAPTLRQNVLPSRTGLNWRRECRPSTRATRPNGIQIFSSRSPGPCPATPSSCSAWSRNGLISNETAKRRIPSPESWLETSCSGQREGTALGGTWSQPMITALLAVISSR